MSPQEDDLAVDFVMAAANLRAAAYGIPTQTWFDAKGMAGNIVHAVATTNAVISGLITLEAMKLLARAPAACRVRGAACNVLPFGDIDRIGSLRLADHAGRQWVERLHGRLGCGLLDVLRYMRSLDCAELARARCQWQEAVAAAGGRYKP